VKRIRALPFCFDLPLLPGYTLNSRVNATLDALPKRRYNPIWPQGTKQPLTKELADYFFSLVSTCDSSLLQLLRSHPELPHFNQLDNWRRRRTWFSEGWKLARLARADFLAEKCADLAKTATPQTAHLARVQFDIYRWLAAKLHPDAYGDKPAATPNTTVNVGVALSAERLNEIRAKLDHTRTALLHPDGSNPVGPTSKQSSVVSRASEAVEGKSSFRTKSDTRTT
jgi:Bacteriophage Sf6, terminase small subunit-like